MTLGEIVKCSLEIVPTLYWSMRDAGHQEGQCIAFSD